MKSTLFIALCLGIAILACNKEKSSVKPSKNQTSSTPFAAARFEDTTAYQGTKFIPITVANNMISSYLYSINSNNNDTDVRSFTVNADSLRAYLNNNDIKNVKLIFAHTASYINAGNGGVHAGYQSGGLTIIIAGYNDSGNYVYHNGMVLDHVAPCPYTCPGSGPAANYLLQ